MKEQLRIAVFLLLLWASPIRLSAKVPADTTGIVFTTIQAKTVPHQKKAEAHALQMAISTNNSLWAVFIAGFLGGLAALLMPCIFPMLPLTVGYFTKIQASRKKGIEDAIVYGLSIIVIYVGLGMLVTISFGASALNNLATNGVFNLFFFLLLIVFAASFLGAFEITLPNRWVNKAEENTNRRGISGLFFMAAVLALVSFSCAGPIIGTLLVQTATTGARLAPAIGMLGFSVALALPFVLFALFPSWLSRLPKSGGWLNSVKVILGFLELALSLKFLSNVDLTYHWRLFDREVFLVLWIVIFGLMGIYLLGKLKLNHDNETTYIPVPRLFLSIITLAFTVYMVPGLWGAPLKSIAAFLPPQDTQDFDLYTPTLAPQPPKGGEIAEVKYASLFHAPLNLYAFFDYDEGLAYAKSMHKPVLIDFTGHACVNCRKMEATIWPDKAVLPLIRDEYVLIQLYVDDKTTIAGGQTIGDENSALQARKFDSNSQPDYALLDDNGNLLVPTQGAIYDPAAYAAYLQSGLDRFRREQGSGGG